MNDVLWVGLAVAFFLGSAWFVAFCDRLMPALRAGDEAERTRGTDNEEADR